MPGAGDLTERWIFQQRAVDANGDRLDGWEQPGHTVWTSVLWLRGTEAVMQGRLTGVQPIVLTVRASLLTRQITPSWRAIDSRQRDRTANITGVSPARQRGFLDILATIGVAQG